MKSDCNNSTFTLQQRQPLPQQRLRYSNKQMLHRLQQQESHQQTLKAATAATITMAAAASTAAVATETAAAFAIAAVAVQRGSNNSCNGSCQNNNS
jgi:hypothetical protein